MGAGVPACLLAAQAEVGHVGGHMCKGAEDAPIRDHERREDGVPGGAGQAREGWKRRLYTAGAG